MKSEFGTLDDATLLKAALDVGLGHGRAKVVVELADRALSRPELLRDALKAIAIDKRIGFHHGAPVGWFGADHLFLSQQERAIGALLKEMDSWEASEQEDLVRHWAGRGRLAELTGELSLKYDWSPRYKLT